MEFVKLEKELLQKLRDRGYNVLVSNQPLNDDVLIYWYPERVDDVCEYVVGLDGTPFNEPNILVIQDALDNIDEGDLVGMVWVQ